MNAVYLFRSGGIRRWQWQIDQDRLASGAQRLGCRETYWGPNQMAQYVLLRLLGDREPEQYPIDAKGIIIGRSTDADIVVDGRTVSRAHVRVWILDGTACAEDLGSRNGFKVNGERLRNAYLGHGDHLVVGDGLFIVQRNGDLLPRIPGVDLDDEKSARRKTPEPRGRSRRMKTPPLPMAPRQDRGDILLQASDLYEGASDRKDLLRKALASSMDAVQGDRALVFSPMSAACRDPKIVEFGTRVVRKSSNPLDRELVYEVAAKNAQGQGELSDGKVRGADRGLGNPWALCVPILSDRTCVGLLYVDSARDPEGFTKDCMKLLGPLADLAGDTWGRLGAVKRRIRRV